MGMKDWLDKIKQKVEDRKKEESDPAIVRKKKKEANEKNFRRMTTAIKWAKQGMEGYNTVSKKAGEITDAAAEKAGDLAEKAKPIAEKIDNAAAAVGETAKGAFEAVKDKVAGGVDAANKKLDEAREDSAKKPSTGSSLLDFIAPAVPETDATKPKDPQLKPPAPPKP
jgi:hypothetical protein